MKQKVMTFGANIKTALNSNYSPINSLTFFTFPVLVFSVLFNLSRWFELEYVYVSDIIKKTNNTNSINNGSNVNFVEDSRNEENFVNISRVQLRVSTSVIDNPARQN